VHSIPQLEIAQREIRIGDMKIESVPFRLIEPIVLFDLGVEPFERLEVQPLVGIVKRLTEIQILQFLGLPWTCRQTGDRQEPEHP